MNIIFQIDGGLGKCVAATAVCKAIKTKYPTDKLIVVSGYPDVFFGNPNVDLNYAFNERLYFYQNHIKDQNIRMMVHNPYLESDFIAEKGHLIPIWCNMFGLEYKGEMPELFLNPSETGFFSTMFNSDKPLFVITTVR